MRRDRGIPAACPDNGRTIRLFLSAVARTADVLRTAPTGFRGVVRSLRTGVRAGRFAFRRERHRCSCGRRCESRHGARMEALFIGQAYIDVTFLADEIPTGDEKAVAEDYSISFGGNAVTAAFCCAKLGIAPDLHEWVADARHRTLVIHRVESYGLCFPYKPMQVLSRPRI